ncbi:MULTISPECIES: TetR/AcrR family transcriptional regulator [Actinoalloteichus]|uniref:Transcriptional regulator, TetR family n=1 Tax=Actinoalloteichus fjordicus TaxID=1612552 RepID=A0AAC9LC79_9PSEU|nr:MULTISPECIES: TetR/AcrR family transcriptional regulator [Actinoalloteichus]APU14926.1 transcriptional regulator, TetR family [Actinoalloteichus fjordicus]APU20996.1 transcriptional regulator, TetR family [Actinoalloteichus sp. GBA129-24]
MEADRPTLTRRRVLAEALVLVDTEGTSALGVRRLAARLGVTPMALYNHVGGRQDLVDGLAETVLAKARLSPADRSPYETIVAQADALYRAYRAHPNVVPLIRLACGRGDEIAHPFLAVEQACRAAGPTADPVAIWISVNALAAGFAEYEAAGHAVGHDFETSFRSSVETLVRGLLPAARAPS